MSEPTGTVTAVTPTKPKDLAMEIRLAHQGVIVATKDILAKAMLAGDLLREAKDTFGQHGEWLPWLEKHCRIPERTVQRYMLVASHRKEIEEEMKSANLADLTITRALKVIKGLANDNGKAGASSGKAGASGKGGSGANPADAYDKVEEKLIARLEDLDLEAAEAAAENTIRELKATVAKMKKFTEKRAA